MIHSIENIIFLITWFGLITFAIMLMSNGWRVMEKNPEEEKFKNIHPELEGLKEGDELLVVNFNQIPDPRRQNSVDPRFKLDSPELHNLGDPLHNSLRDRIESLKDEEDEDDDDGGAAVLA